MKEVRGAPAPTGASRRDAHRGGIGRALLRARVLQEIAERDVLPARHDRRADLRSAGGHRGGAQHHRQNALGGAAAERVVHADEMSSGNVTGFVAMMPIT